MSQDRERVRRVLSQPTCTVAANIFDPLSARIASMLDYDVCLLSGSVGKVATVGVPDIVLYNLSDAVDHCRRILRMADVSYGPLEEALDRIRAYAQTGVEAIRRVGLRTRKELEAVHQATSLPLTVLGPPPELLHDRAFLAAHGVRVLMLGNPAFAMAVKAIYDCFKHVKDGGAVEDLSDRQAAADLLRAVNRTEEFLPWQQRYLRA